MSRKARLGFGLAGILPLLAPYNLLLKPAWGNALGFSLLFTFVVSLGATAVAVLLLLVAIYGINRRVEFDKSAEVVRVLESNLLQRAREVNYAFADIAQLELVYHDWSTGPSTYEICLTPRTGKPFAFGNFSSRVDVEATLSMLRGVIGNTP